MLPFIGDNRFRRSANCQRLEPDVEQLEPSPCTAIGQRSRAESQAPGKDKREESEDSLWSGVLCYRKPIQVQFLQYFCNRLTPAGS